MKLEKEKYEISDFKPQWIDANFPKDDEYLAVKDIIKFYLFNCPCERLSSRGADITRWGKPSIVLLEKIKTELKLKKGVNYDYGNSKPAMHLLFDKYNLETDFTNVKSDMLVFENDGNVFDKIFRHIRNSIAHGRWQVIDSYYYFEDGSDETFDGEVTFCVTARIVLSYDSLIKMRDIILEGPTEEELKKINLEKELEELMKKLSVAFKKNYFKRKDAIEKLQISNDVWKKLYTRGRKKSYMKFDKGSWVFIKSVK